MTTHDVTLASVIARRLSLYLSLPPGYKCEYHVGTDNILIYNQDLGFCITGVYCDAHSYCEIRSAAAQMLSCLINETAGIKSFQPTQELLNPSVETKFAG